MARLITHSPPPSRTLDSSNIACSECVVDCDDADCMAEIDDHCTEQCVIVPCDNPEHGDMQCPKGNCESTCGVPDPCSLVSIILWNALTISDIVLQSGHPHAACDTFQHRGITCAQNSCSMSTCDDPDNCSLVDAVSSRHLNATLPSSLSFETECIPPYRSQDITEHAFTPHTDSGELEAALEAMLCSCGVTSSHEDDTVPHNLFRGPYGGPSPTLSTLTSPSETNSLPSAFNSPLPLPAYTPALYLTQPPVVPPGHTCLWNGCGSSFSSLEELITHVNISHLHAYSSQIIEPVADLSSYMRLNPDVLGPSCQWDNCHEYSSAPPNSSSLRVDALNSLVGHLLHDHLGLQDGPGDHTAITANHVTPVDVGLPVPVPDLAQDAEMPVRAEEQHSDNKHQGIPSARNTKQDEVNKPKNERRPTTTEVKTSTEKCRWRGCERLFENVDDLMNHLTVVHVGSGKNHYECLWSGCERNGQNGFGSKQKVCRHLQVRICPGSAIPFDLICNGGNRCTRVTNRSSASFANSIFPRRRLYNSICAVIHKKVCGTDHFTCLSASNVNLRP
jgi:hypothetical protein